MANEVELKLLIAPDDIERLLHHPVFQTIVRRELLPQQLLSVYYDTLALDLKKQRVALRLRRTGNRWIQTVKTEGTVAGGLHERPEWECETTEDTLDFESIPNPTVREFFADEKIHRALRPVFVTEFTRTSSVLEFPGGDVIELSIDQGEIRAGDQQTPICEVELELKAGHPHRLFALALELQESIPLKLENVSKAERGYRLVTAAALVPVKAKILDLAENVSASEAFVRILQDELAHLQANEEGTLQSDNPEFVHQMRVALRRMRSALSLFSDLVGGEDNELIRHELQWLAKELDAVRNWDVFVTQTLPTILDEFSGEQGLERLKTKSEDVRQQCRLRAREAVTSSHYQKLLLQVGAWLYAQPWVERLSHQGNVTADEPIAKFSARVLQQFHKQLQKRGEHLAILSPEERHQVRIAAKKLRYAAEFFSSLYSQKRVRRYMAALANVQEVLGTLNDATTTEQLLRELARPEEGTPVHEATTLVLGWGRGANHVRREQLAQVWKDLAKQKVFW